MTLRLGHMLAALTGAAPLADAPQAADDGPLVASVAIDSRRVEPGSLFAAFVGERTDGHYYLEEAVRRGAIALLVERPDPAWPALDLRHGRAAVWNGETPVQLWVESTAAALQQAAAWWRNCFPQLRVIGVTGSVGKTTTKELTHAVLAQRATTFKTEQNFNNEIGLPLELLRLTGAEQYAVLEMGLYVPGDIALLCAIGRPQVGVLTTIATVHLERTGTLEALIAGKRELVEALPADGVAVLNADDPHVRGMAPWSAARVVTYGVAQDGAATADVWADQVRSYGLGGVQFRLHCGDEPPFPVQINLQGRHHVYTALRAAAVAWVEGLTPEEIAAGLASHRDALRLRVLRGSHGICVLDDTYNAAPPSVTAALDLLAELDGRKVAVLGDMLELGSDEEDGHRRVGRRAAAVADLLVTVGRLGRLIAEEALAQGKAADAVHWAADADAALALLERLLQPGDVVLIKASRGARLDRLAAALTGGS